MSSIKLFLAAAATALAQQAAHIVVFKDGADVAQHHKAMQGMMDVTRSFDLGQGRLQGYAGVPATEAALSALRAHEAVAYVERDIPLTIKGRGGFKPMGGNATCVTQSNCPSWGIERVSETKLPLDGTYRYTDGVGSNVMVYMLDTGVRVTHKEFQGRAAFAYNAAGGKVNTDTDGHGTHVAGTVAAEHYGICKECNILSVKVFADNGDCSASILIKGFEWVMHNYNQSTAEAHVINISVGGDPGETSDAMDAAVNALVAAGVHVVGAAGNENTDACTESPGRAAGIIAVGSTMILADTSDYFLGGSNFGKCVDIFAPGDKIVSLGIGSDTEVGVVDSGTSMSSPHVAGTVARFASLHPNATLPEVQKMVMAAGLKGVIGGVPSGTVNLLVHKDCE